MYIICLKHVCSKWTYLFTPQKIAGTHCRVRALREFRWHGAYALPRHSWCVHTSVHTPSAACWLECLCMCIWEYVCDCVWVCVCVCVCVTWSLRCCATMWCGVYTHFSTNIILGARVRSLSHIALAFSRSHRRTIWIHKCTHTQTSFISHTHSISLTHLYAARTFPSFLLSLLLALARARSVSHMHTCMHAHLYIHRTHAHALFLARTSRHTNANTHTEHTQLHTDAHTHQYTFA